LRIDERVPEYIRTLIPYPPGKPIEEVERELGIKGSIKLASNENPLGPSRLALEAVQKRLMDLHFYPDGSCYTLKHRLAEFFAVSTDNIILGNGSNELIEFAVRTFMLPGDEAVMGERAFPIFRLVVQAAGGRAILVPFKDFTHDLEAMADAVTERTRILFLANPNNPTGTIYRTDEWRGLLARVPATTLIVADEAYFEYVDDPDYPNSLLDQAEERPLLTLRTFSKIYGLAGLRVGYGIGPKKIVGLMERVRQPFNVNSMAQWAAQAALSDRSHVSKSAEVNRIGLRLLRERLASMGFPTVPSWANFLLVHVGDGAEVYQKLMRLGVIVRPMGGYGYPEHIRVTVGTEPENLRFLTALGQIFEGTGSSRATKP
jgi:histidinol-phosphate aminotransferase